MKNLSDIFGVILIDDDPAEKQIVQRVLNSLTDQPFRLDHVTRCSKALRLLEERAYDLVLLDNRLSKRMSAKFSVPMIKNAIGTAPIAVISNDITPAYLQDRVALGVDFVVDKSNLVDFLSSQMPRLLGLGGAGSVSPQTVS